MTKPVYALYAPGNPRPLVFNNLRAIPEGVEVWFYPEPDLPIPGVRFGSRFWPLLPTGAVGWEIALEKPTLEWDGVKGDRFSVTYYPREERLICEIYQGDRLAAQEEIHEPNARFMAAEILGGEG